MREILRYFLSGTVLSVSRLIVGLFRAKYVAVAFGAAGVGVLAQGNQVQQLAMAVASLSLASGMVQRMLSGAREGDSDREKRVLSTAFLAQLATMALLAIITLPFLPKIAQLVFGRSDMTIHFLFIVISVPFYVLSSGFIESLFFALNRFDLYVKSSVVAAILGLAVFFVLVFFYGVYGMFLSFTVSGILFFALNVVFIYRLRKPSEIFLFKGFSWTEFRALFRYSAVLLVGGMTTYFVNLAMRTFVVRRLGIEVNGLVQVPVALSAYYSSLLTNLMWSRLYPRSSEKGDTEEMHREFFHLLDFLIFAQVGIGLVLMAALEIFIRVIYTKEFLASSPLVATFLAGDFFYFTVFAFGIYLLGIGLVKRYLFLIVFQGIAFLTLGYVLEPLLRMQFFPAAYLGSAVLASLPVLFWMMRMSGISRMAKLKYFVRQAFCCGMLMIQAFLLYNGAAWWIRAGFAAIFGAYVIYFFFRSGYIVREEGKLKLKI